MTNNYPITDLAKLLVSQLNNSPEYALTLEGILGSPDDKALFISSLSSEFNKPTNVRRRTLNSVKLSIKSDPDDQKTRAFASEVYQKRISDNVPSPQWLLDYVGNQASSDNFN